MATYAIGDIQGCHASLRGLLDRLPFDPDRDRLWLAGDLVNRGPASLEVLRWASGLGDRVVAVLGNHDLHLLGVAAGLRSSRPRDTLAPVLAAPDADELLTWLRHRPLLHREGRFVLVHAGLHPAWTADDAQALAAEIEAGLRGPRWRAALAELFVEDPPPWSPHLTGAARRAAAASLLTTLRTCTADGTPDRSFHGPPDRMPPGRLAWFDVPARRAADVTVVCGHWAALGLLMRPDIIALDTGCVWGGALTAIRLEDGALFQQPRID